jgi:RNA polymerase nonessential primary-like sigma factor
MDRGQTVRLPAHVSSRATKLRKAITQLDEQTGETLSVTDASKLLGIPREEAGQLLNHVTNPITSLQAPVMGEDEAEELGEFVDDGQPPVELVVENEIVRAELMDAIHQHAGLNRNEADVVKWRFGLEPFPGKMFDSESIVPSLEDVGRYLHLSRERIRQIETKGILKLQEHFVKNQKHLSLHPLDD